MSKIKLKDALNSDIYSIVLEDGVKQIKFWGYLYCAGCTVTNNPDDIYRNVEYTFCYLPIEKMIELRFNGDLGEYLDNLWCETKQYIGDLTEKEAQDCLDSYFGRPPIPLQLQLVNTDTPCGDYIDM